jgi:F-box/leucine-rich repeat protein 4
MPSGMDLVAEALANHNPKLLSVDMWKTYSLSAVGLRSLACLKHLEEVELGWWYDFLSLSQ